LDFTNNYGVRPFWPFWEKWYSWDIVFIIEPLLLILLIGGLVLPALFSLINDEIGVRRKGPAGRLAAVVALLGVVAVWACATMSTGAPSTPSSPASMTGMTRCGFLLILTG